MEPLERAAVLLTLMRELQQLMKRENALLREMRLDRLAELQAAKSTLAEAYEMELRAFREPTYALFCVGMFLVFFGLFFAFYYVASFATGVVGLPTEKAFALLMVMNAAGFVFRLLPGLLADRLTGPLNLMLPFAFATAMLTYSWAAVKSPLGTWIWAIFYGLIAAGVQGLFPAVLSSLTTDLTKQGVRMGMGFAIVGLAGATGPPVAGAIIQACGGRYIGAQMWAGTSILLGVCFLLAARTVKVGWQLKRI